MNKRIVQGNVLQCVLNMNCKRGVFLLTGFIISFAYGTYISTSMWKGKIK